MILIILRDLNGQNNEGRLLFDKGSTNREQNGGGGKRHRRSHRGPGGLGPQREWKKLHNSFSCTKGTNIYVKVLCLVIVNVNVTKYIRQEMSNMTDLWLSGDRSVFSSSKYSKIRFQFGLRPGPR